MPRSDSDPAVRGLLRQVLPDLTGAAADLHRVARSSGGLVLVDWHGPAAEAFRIVVHDLVATASELAGRADSIAEQARYQGLAG
jgi:hypothetical protein